MERMRLGEARGFDEVPLAGKLPLLGVDPRVAGCCRAHSPRVTSASGNSKSPGRSGRAAARLALCSAVESRALGRAHPGDLRVRLCPRPAAEEQARSRAPEAIPGPARPGPQRRQLRRFETQRPVGCGSKRGAGKGKAKAAGPVSNRVKAPHRPPDAGGTRACPCEPSWPSPVRRSHGHCSPGYRVRLLRLFAEGALGAQVQGAAAGAGRGQDGHVHRRGVAAAAHLAGLRTGNLDW